MKKIKLPKKFWVKGKSKFLELRPELKNKVDFSISKEEKEKQEKDVIENRMRRFKKYGKA